MTLLRYAHALGKRLVWTLQDEQVKGENTRTGQKTKEVTASVEAVGGRTRTGSPPATLGRERTAAIDVKTGLRPAKKRALSSAALAAQIGVQKANLAERYAQQYAADQRVAERLESPIEIREKRYVVHFLDAFEVNLADLQPHQENPIILLLERLQDAGEDLAVELLNVLVNRGEAQQLALKILEATEFGEPAVSERRGLTVREMLGLIAHYAIEGSADPDALVDVAVWHEDETAEMYPATMVSGHVTKKTVTVFAKGDNLEEAAGEVEPTDPSGEQQPKVKRPRKAAAGKKQKKTTRKRTTR